MAEVSLPPPDPYSDSFSAWLKGLESHFLERILSQCGAILLEREPEERRKREQLYNPEYRHG